MKKYKLIKEYPGSPTLGTIKTVQNISIEGEYPEFWEEVVEKDYEILEYYQERFTYSKNHQNWHYISKQNYPIKTVKRLSDSEVFTINDFVKETITGKCDGWKISEFSLKDTRCFSCGVNINNIEKIKKPLFITEDGVDIYKSDKFYCVTFPIDFEITKRFGGDGLAVKEEWVRKRTFSTKKAAEEYILFNKPNLSLNDVFRIYPRYKKHYRINTKHAEDLIKLAKSKQ